MSNVEAIIKYDMGATTSVAGQQPYKNIANIDILNWKFTDEMNQLKIYEVTTPNDEYHRANLLIERNVTIPFITPMNGIIVQKRIEDDVIKIKIIEDGFHLNRRLWRKGTLNDTTDANNHLTLSGTATYVDGRHARAFSFNDSTNLSFQHGTIPAVETAFDFERTSSFSLGGWLKINPSDVGQHSEKTLYDKINGVVGIRVFFGADNLLYISLTETNTTNQVKVHYATSVMTNEWIHVFVTYSGTSNAAGVKLYVNGSIVSLVTDFDTLTSSILNNTNPRLGFQYKGLMDEWRIYNVALNPTRVTEVYSNTEDLANLVSRHEFNSARHHYSHTGINVIAQAILDDANTDQPSGVTWVLEPGTPTTEVDFKAKFATHWEALQGLADTANCDLWLDTQDYKVNMFPLKTKGKTLTDKLDLTIKTVPELNLEEFANQMNVLGQPLGNDKQMESIVEVTTDLKYKYEKVLSSATLDTQAKATGVAEKLLLEHKILTPTVKAQMPYDQFVRYVLETGDTVRLVEPTKEISGYFRVMEIKVTPKQANLLLESSDTAVSPTRKQSLTDIISIMLERIRTNEIVG